MQAKDLVLAPAAVGVEDGEKYLVSKSQPFPTSELKSLNFQGTECLLPS